MSIKVGFFGTDGLIKQLVASIFGLYTQKDIDYAMDLRDKVSDIIIKRAFDAGKEAKETHVTFDMYRKLIAASSPENSPTNREKFKEAVKFEKSKRND